MSPIRLFCDDPAVREPIQAWLDGMELEPPGSVALHVRVGADLPRWDDPRQAFQQPGVEIRAGPPLEEVRLEWTHAPARAAIAPGALRADVWLSPAAVERLDACIPTFILIALVFVLRRSGWHHVHGATAIDPDGRGWLIAGNSHAGKSTTTAMLASRGWAVGTDDTAFICDGGDRVAVVGCRGPIALREGGHRLIGLAAGTPLHRRRKTGLTPEELGGRWVERVVPDLVLFTEVGDQTTTARRLGPAETLAQLVRWSAWVVLEPDLAQGHLDLLSRLAGQARGWRVTLGRDLFDRPERLMEVIS